MKVFLTTPHFTKVVEPLYDKPDFVRNSIASLAAYLMLESSYEVLCCDAKFENKSMPILVDNILDFSPDIIGISAFTYEIEDAGDLATTIKKLMPGTLVVVGGSHVSAIPEQTLLEFDGFDIGVVGEAEITLKEICFSIDLKKSIHDIKGIVFRKGESIIFTGEREKIEDLNLLPMPAWQLLPPAKEYHIQTSRGCPFNCNFCFNPNGNKVRQKSAEKIIKEIEFVINYADPKKIFFGDEAFGANKEFAFELLDLLIEHDISTRLQWIIQTHVSLIDEELLDKMKKAGVIKLEMGVESGNSTILKNMGKGIDKDKIINAFTLAKRHKIKTGAFLIFGHPNETRKTIIESISFIARLNPTEPVIAIMVPFPGTIVSSYVNQNKMGYIKTNAGWSSYRKQINGAMRLNNISNRQLKLYLVTANLWVYLRNFRFYGLVKFEWLHKQSLWSFLKNM